MLTTTKHQQREALIENISDNSKSSHQNYGAFQQQDMESQQFVNSSTKYKLDLTPQSRNVIIRTLDKYDRYLSAKVHTWSLPSYLEYFILPFGLIFNRMFCFVSGFFTALFAYYKPEITKQNSDLDGRLYSSLIFFLYNVIIVFILLFLTQTMKKAIRRERPARCTVQRNFNLRGMEKGTLAMPSGDSAQCTLWCVLMYLTYGGNDFFLMACILPALVSFARIFYQCHYVGDVIMGCMVGLLMAVISFYNFNRYVNLFASGASIPNVSSTNQ
eukprot:403356839